MSQIFGYLLAALFGYLVGAIPFGYLVVKLLTGQDIRGVGSGAPEGQTPSALQAPSPGS